MDSIHSSSKTCPFCGQLIIGSDVLGPSLCQNPSCKSRIFVEGNLIHHRQRLDLGIGRIIRIGTQSIDSDSVQLTEYCELLEDFHTKQKKSSMRKIPTYAVDFPGFYETYLYPDQIVHVVFEENMKVRIEKKYASVLKFDLHSADGIIRYDVAYSDGTLSTVDETQISNILRNPLDLYTSGHLDSKEQFFLRFWSHQFYDLYGSNLLKIITNSRISILPHQIGVAHTLLQSFNARYILADEVGLGKTIEAGIFIKEMLARGLATRVLIITPASITGQWEFELKSKFNLNFKRISSSLMKTLKLNVRSGNVHNCQTGEDVPLCTVSLQYARMHSCGDFLLQFEWDIVIIDEAHHLRRYITNLKSEQYRTTLAYDLAKDLSDRARNLLLLTATPIQLHSFDLFSLIELLNPYEFPTFQSFELARQNLPVINQIVQNLKNFTRINTFERKALPNQIAFFEIGQTIEEIENNLPSQTRRLEYANLIEKKHFLSRYVIRNRKRIVFPDNPIKRIPHVIDVELTPDELALYNKIHLYLAKIYSQSIDSGMRGFGFVMVIMQKLLTSSAPALLKSLRKRVKYLEENQDMILKLESETENVREFIDEEASQDYAWGLEELALDDRLTVQNRQRKATERRPEKINIRDHIHILQEFITELEKQQTDSKALKLIALIRSIFQRNASEKVIIFTQFKETLFYLEKLLEKEHIAVAEFHGDLNEQQKNASVLAFRHEIPVLLSTEIGGEGRNFQFCHIQINYDLPWNPMRLEQRIGRLDRLGQTQNVLIYNFYIKDTVESSIVNAITERIRLFEESIGALEPILGSLEGQIADLVLREDEVPLKFRIDEVVQKTSNTIETVEAKLADFILDKHSFQYDRVSKELDRTELLTDIDLLAYCHIFTETMNHIPLKQNGNSVQQFEFYPIQKVDDKGIWQIRVPNWFQSQLRIPSNRYEGVFDIDLARTEEEYDFFALGHPFIMNLIEWCYRDDFAGFTTEIVIESGPFFAQFGDSSAVHLSARETNLLQDVLHQKLGLNLFLFEIEFLGILVERMVIPVVISDELDAFPILNAFFKRPHNLYPLITQQTKIGVQSSLPKISLIQLQTIFKDAQQSTKRYIKNRAEELTVLNQIQYEEEVSRAMRMAEFQKKYAEMQLKTNQDKLRVKKVKLPTDRQIQNAESLQDSIKKGARLKEFQKIREEIQYYEHEIARWQEKIANLSFDLPEKLKRLKKYRQLMINAELLGYARVFLI